MLLYLFTGQFRAGKRDWRRVGLDLPQIVGPVGFGAVVFLREGRDCRRRVGLDLPQIVFGLYLVSLYRYVASAYPDSSSCFERPCSPVTP